MSGKNDFFKRLTFKFRVPLAYSIGFERFEKLKEGPYEGEDISCDKKDECRERAGECLKPGGLEFGWAYNGDKVHASMQSGKDNNFSL